jgi:hypothetical protein
MRIPVIRHGRIAALAFGIGWAGILCAVLPGNAVALTPNSPEVVESIEKGIKFLDSDQPEARYGGIALQGLCLLKHTADPAYPRVVSCAEKLQKALGAHDPTKLDNGWDIYSAGLAVIFFVEREKAFVDAAKDKAGKDKAGKAEAGKAEAAKDEPGMHRADVECLLTFLQNRQKKHGGWGYEGRDTGDTSMTQYGVLSAWIASHAGYKVPMESIENVSTWLMRTQDPSGAFGYQGNYAPTAGALVAQSEIRPSMSAAASGSLYVCAEFLGLVEDKEKRKDLPNALREVKKKDAKKKRPRSNKIDIRAIRETETRAKAWLEANNKLEGLQWTHYYLYALERCMAFRYLFEQSPDEVTREPEWYNEGAKFLMKTQGKDGSWNGQCGSVPDTAFSVLFLKRSTRTIIEHEREMGESTAIGGRGLPVNTDGDIRIDSHGNVVVKPISSDSDTLIDVIEHQSGEDFDSKIAGLADLPGSQIETLTSKYGDKIRDLVGNKSPKARLAAVKALGKTRDLDNVETLIFALTDPDPSVIRAANEGLLRIRRVTTEILLPDNFSEEDRRLLVEKWKNWYQSVRPGVEMK